MPQWDAGMKGVSYAPYAVMPSAIAATWAHGYFNKDKVMMRNGYKSAIAVGLAMITTSGLKIAINRTRPFKEYPNDITLRVKEPGPYSFPSGHTTSAFATATALSLSYKKWYVAVPSYLYAGFVGYSRMRLGVHYPSDVLGGMAIGIGAGFLTWWVDKKVNGL
ncbi:MAG: phosphatase PAP2 family protein [Bacteroidia bacterium]|nr:phosphatase PAP2 family protein [Bacteroidia bacterium]